MRELFELLETEDVVNSNRQYGLALKYGHANADQNRSANGHANGHDSTPIAGTGRRSAQASSAQRPIGVAGVEPQASPQSGPAIPSHVAPLGAAKTPTPATRIQQSPGAGGVPRSGSPRVLDGVPGDPQSGAPRPHGLSIDAPSKERFRLLSGAQLNSSRFETRYLIPGILIAGQPGGIFGAFKTLKNSLAADLMISLASGTPFLGRFPVPEPGKVLFLSGESGLPALQSIARRICAQRGLALESLGNLVLSADLPRLDQPADVLALEQLVERHKPVCVVIDPAYLALGGDHSRDLFAMGQLLRPLTDLCKSTGCTVLLVHHCKRSRKSGDPATLDDVAGSGFAEFSAQWLLLSRRRPFDPGTGKHELWLTGGSRVGHQGLWELDIDEGTVGQPGGCAWKTTLRPVTSAEAQVDERFAAASEDRRLRRRAAAFGHQRQRVWEVLAAYPDGCNATVIRDALGINGERMKRIFQVLVEERVVQKTEEQVDRRRFKVTYQRIPSVMDLSPAAVEARRAHPPDQKVYNLRSGHFVDRSGTGAVGPKLVGWIGDRLRAVDPGTPTNPLADKPPVPPIEGVEVLPLPKSGPDTFSNKVGTQDVAQTQSNAAVQPQPPQGGDRA